MPITTAPPLVPGETLLRVKVVAERARCLPGAIYDAIRGGRVAAVSVADVLFITEAEAERFIREWPTGNRGVSARWAEYRRWKAAQATQRAGDAAP
jgi:hypothetical protein